MQLRNTLVAGINQDLGVSQDPYLRLLEQPKVMPLAIGERGAEHPQALLVNDQLGF